MLCCLIVGDILGGDCVVTTTDDLLSEIGGLGGCHLYRILCHLAAGQIGRIWVGIDCKVSVRDVRRDGPNLTGLLASDVRAASTASGCMCSNNDVREVVHCPVVLQLLDCIPSVRDGTDSEIWEDVDDFLIPRQFERLIS